MGREPKLSFVEALGRDDSVLYFEEGLQVFG